MIEDRHQRCKEDNHRQYLHYKYEAPRARRIGCVSKDETSAFICERDHPRHCSCKEREQRRDGRKPEQEKCDRKLNRHANNNGAAIDGAAIGGTQPADEQNGDDTKNSNVLLHVCSGRRLLPPHAVRMQHTDSRPAAALSCHCDSHSAHRHICRCRRRDSGSGTRSRPANGDWRHRRGGCWKVNTGAQTFRVRGQHRQLSARLPNNGGALA